MSNPSDPRTACHTTKVRNMTGKTAFFGYLPPRGKRLAPGETYVFNGDLRQFYAAVTKKRYQTALFNALKDGDLVIEHTPAEHHYDETLDVVKVVKVNNGSVAAADPCTGGYSSSIGG